MSSSKTFFTLVCLLALTPLLRGEAPAAGRVAKIDSRSSDSSGDMKYRRPEKIGGKSMDQWIGDLKSLDPAVRAAAVVALVGFQDTDGKAIPALVKMAGHDDDASPRAKAVIALGMLPHLDVQRPSIIKGLASVIRYDHQAIIRYKAIESLSSLMRLQPLNPEERAAVIPALVANVNATTTFDLRLSAIKALMMAGPDPKKGPDYAVTKALLTHAQYSQERSAEVRLYAIIALGSLGRPQHPQELGEVLGTLKNVPKYEKNRAIRMWAHVGMLVLDVDTNYDKELKEIVKTLEEAPEAAMKSHALMALAALKDKSNQYVPNICKVLLKDIRNKERDASVRSAGAMALGYIGNKGELAIGTLIKVTEDADPNHFDAVIAACVAFTQLKANTPEVVEAFDRLLDRPGLQDYQKKTISALKEQLIHPPKKLADQPKSPEKGIGGGKKK
jgi:HEAT repeat protein